MTETYVVGDDGHVVVPITDSEGGLVDWAGPQVRAGDTVITAEWDGDPAVTRDLLIPVATLAVGVYDLWLVIDGDTDILLGRVEIVDAAAPLPSEDTECLWPVDPACLTEEWDAFSTEVQVRARRLATATLIRLTAGRVGNCPITVRPVPKQNVCWFPTDPYPSRWMTPVNWAGEWLNCTPCGTSGCEFTLPGPVGRVDTVKIDGVVLDPTEYRLDGNTVIWMGSGDCPFPASQNLSLPDTEPGTFSVTYLNTFPVDSIGAYAAGILAMEYGKACTGAQGCRLPKGVTTIVKQGVTMTLTPGVFPDGLTGIREVDTYITLWNPQGHIAAPTVWSPDSPVVRT